MGTDEHGSVKAVFELREAALQHGMAIAELKGGTGRGDALDGVLATKIRLEEKKAAAIDECSENAEIAVEQVTKESH